MNGLVPVRKYCCELSGKLVWEFNKDEENKNVYKKWCDMEKEQMLKKYKERNQSFIVNFRKKDN